ncbi:MAG TPA: Fe-Mn family superoxide dismutase [Alphaproteobacteria bacterium]|nr:Fe-Mn family superoxide dismutase [Alphaproteobacteria bacterium]
MRYEIRPLNVTPAELDGLSERLIVSHYVNNYGGAVRRSNVLAAELAKLDFTTTPGFVINGLKREELMAANSALLHEVYFDSLGGSGAPTGEIARALERDFGGVERWRAEFMSMGKALAGGSGWVVLCRSRRDGRLINQWASDHGHSLADGAPILALDMYEHAYHIDFGARAEAYVEAFMRNIDWSAVARRFEQAADRVATNEGATAITPEELRGEVERIGRDLLLLDVRRRQAHGADTEMIRGAEWREPECVESWADSLPKDRPVVVYCVYGHNVSQDVTLALRARGIDARHLAGGIAAWRALAGPTMPRTASK